MSSSNFTPPKPKRPAGGYQFHKPGCGCPACVSRKRKAEAVTGGAGAGGENVGETRIIMPHIGMGDKKIPDEILYAELSPIEATGRSARDRVAQWIYFRAQEPGITNAEVAKRLGLSSATLNSILSRARKEGWLVIEDPLTKLEVELIPKIVENLNGFLDAKDRTVTIEAAKGVLFPHYRDSKGIQENKLTVLGLKIEMPEDLAAMPRGAVSGQPRSVELLTGEVVGASKNEAPKIPPPASEESIDSEKF